MFSRVFEFINNHRLTIVILIIIILILSLLFAYRGDSYEFLENIEYNPLSNYEGKIVSLKYQMRKNNQIMNYYLAFNKKNMCDNLRDQKLGDCINSVAVFRSTKSSLTNFKLVKSFTDDRYMLVSLANGEHSMNRQDSLKGKESYLCFDGGFPSNVFFFLESNGRGQYRLRFTDSEGESYYLGFCSDSNSVCQFREEVTPRVCSVYDSEKALFFDLELSVMSETEPFEVDDISSMEVNFNDLESVYSLLSGNSNKTDNDSLEGFDDSHTIFSPV